MELCSKVVDEVGGVFGMVFEVIHSYKRSEYAMSEDKIIALKNPGVAAPVADVLTE
ncbi:hypothetical protein [Methylocaldum szegediense]|uniref:hypothetical protein n=1 Tax=Methylocaldum szegediense TaxID=73780 RepID=UPI0012EB3DD6|nr:hypothetical protein [Methylocaldum szegediense]